MQRLLQQIFMEIHYNLKQVVKAKFKQYLMPQLICKMISLKHQINKSGLHGFQDFKMVAVRLLIIKFIILLVQSLKIIYHYSKMLLSYIIQLQ